MVQKQKNVSWGSNPAKRIILVSQKEIVKDKYIVLGNKDEFFEKKGKERKRKECKYNTFVFTKYNKTY